MPQLILPLLLKYWLHLLLLLAGLAAGAYVMHRIDDRVWQKRLDKAVAAERAVAANALAAERKACAASKQISENISREYQNQIDDLDRRLAAARSVRPNRCVPVYLPATGATGGRADQVGPGFPKPSGGVTSDAILDLGHDAEEVNRRHKSCVDFVNEIYRINGQ